jgi:hypothetical protein
MRVNYLSLLIGFGVFAGAMPVLGQTSAGDAEGALWGGPYPRLRQP